MHQIDRLTKLKDIEQFSQMMAPESVKKGEQLCGGATGHGAH